MSDAELKELQSPETWEHTAEDRREPVRSPRAIVSVALSRDDFEFVSAAARSMEMRTSEFIRVAAVEKAQIHSRRATVISASGSLEVRTPYPVTHLRGSRVQLESDPKLVMVGKL